MKHFYKLFIATVTVCLFSLIALHETVSPANAVNKCDCAAGYYLPGGNCDAAFLPSQCKKCPDCPGECETCPTIECSTCDPQCGNGVCPCDSCCGDCPTKKACGSSCTTASDCAGALNGCTICSPFGKCTDSNMCGKRCNNNVDCSGGTGDCGYCNKTLTPALCTKNVGHCGKTCENSGGCDGAKDGCTTCEQTSNGKKCTEGLMCGKTCANAGDCNGAKDGCTTCDPTLNVCTNGNMCDKACENAGDCDGAKDGCTTCDTILKKCTDGSVCGKLCDKSDDCNGGGKDGCGHCETSVVPAMCTKGDCGRECTDNASCAGSKGGCNLCKLNSASGKKECRKASCDETCTSDGDCDGSDGCIKCTGGKCKKGVCNDECSKDSDCGGADGCSVCKSNPTTGKKECQKSGCDDKCKNDSDCDGSSGCVVCKKAKATDVEGVCKKAVCSEGCTKDADCDGGDGCVKCADGVCTKANCNEECSKDSDCAGGADGCSVCKQNPTTGKKECQKSSCNDKCKTSSDCDGASGCVVCKKEKATDEEGVCKQAICSEGCAKDSDCDGGDGCTKCKAHPNTGKLECRKPNCGESCKNSSDCEGSDGCKSCYKAPGQDTGVCQKALCASDCQYDADCDGGDGCVLCRPNATNTGLTCRKAKCDEMCKKDGDCDGANGCVKCKKAAGADTGTCKKASCNESCRDDGDCDGVNGCKTCDPGSKTCTTCIKVDAFTTKLVECETKVTKVGDYLRESCGGDCKIVADNGSGHIFDSPWLVCGGKKIYQYYNPWGDKISTANKKAIVNRTIYIDGSCNVTTFNSATHCVVSTSSGQIATPVSLVWESMDDLKFTVSNFALDPKAKGKWYIWKASAKTPLIVNDPKKTGKITSAEQIFSAHTFGKTWKSGFEALASLDADGDGKLSGDELADLSLWFDKNQNGKADKGEVVDIREAGVTELFYKTDGDDIKTAGLVASKGYTKQDGSNAVTGAAIDWFSVQYDTKKEAQAALDLQVQALNTKGLGLGSEFEGIWLWRTLDHASAKGEDAGSGYLTFINDGGSKINGFATNMIPLKPNADNLAIAIETFGFTGNVVKNVTGRSRIQFTVEAKGHPTNITAELSQDGKTMTGISRAEVVEKGQTKLVHYTWRAEKQ